MKAVASHCWRNYILHFKAVFFSLSPEEAVDYGCPPIIYICFPSAKDPDWHKRHPGNQLTLKN